MPTALTAISFNAALSATAKAGEWREALCLLERMRASPPGGPRPDVLSYNAVLGAFERGGEWRRVAPLLDEMEAAGVRPSVATLTAAMQAVASAGELEEGFQLLERARKLKIAVKGVDTYSLHRTLLEACMDLLVRWGLADAFALTASLASSLPLNLAVYVVSGVFQPLFIMEMSYAGVAAWSKRRLGRGRAHQVRLFTWPSLAPAWSTLSGGATERLRLP